MSSGDTQKLFRWQWPADRTPETRLLAKVSKFEKQKDGLLGTNKSPSIAGNLPDAHVLTGTIVEGGGTSANQVFTLTLPRVEAGDISVNDYVALGIVNNDVCICIAKVPPSESHTKMVEWLANWNCLKK